MFLYLLFVHKCWERRESREGGGGVNTMLAKHTTKKYRSVIECNRNLYKQEVLRAGPINYRDRNNI